MVSDNTCIFGTAFTVSIEAKRGVTTGISAADRARTIQVASALESAAQTVTPDSIVKTVPGLDSVVVYDTKETIKSVSSLAKVLDRRRQQVHIEAVILETRQGEGESIGTNLFATVTAGNWTAGFNSNLTGSDTLTALPLGGSVSISHNADLQIHIQALESSDNTRLLSTPSVVVSSSELARISVGQNVPFVTGSTNIDGTAQPIQTVERHDVGVSLQVQPFVLADGSIDLKITQVSSSVSASSIIAADIITNQRSIDTRLIVQDKQYIMLGGLIGEEEREEVRRVPILGSIPIIGFLFRSTTTEIVRSRLNVVLRVTLV